MVDDPLRRRLRSADERPQHVLQDAAVAVVVRLAGGVDAHDRVELNDLPTVLGRRDLTVLGVEPLLSSVMPAMSKVSVPSRPRESALCPSGNWSGMTPMPMRLERWMRS